MANKGVIELIQDNDPSYDPLETALAKAGVSRDLYNAAFDRVYCDGYYGPINDEEWREQDGREPSSVSDALRVLGRVSDAVEGHHTVEFYPCDDPEEHGCSGEHEEDVEDASADDIRRDLFRPIITIYGRLPF